MSLLNKKELTPEEMAEVAGKYFDKHFKTQTEAAIYFKASPPLVSMVKRGTHSPSDSMLFSMGYEKIKTTIYRKVK